MKSSITYVCSIMYDTHVLFSGMGCEMHNMRSAIGADREILEEEQVNSHN
jgi:hypothetical protein